MAHFPKPFFKKSRGVWYVEIDRRQHNLGPDRDEAFRQYYQLMGQPRERKVSPQSLAAIIDAYLEWVDRNRSADTYEWYRYRLQRFIERYPDLRAADLRPFHVQTWVDSYTLAVTSRRNYFRSVKRCMRWAKVQGYLDINPIADMEVPRAESKTVCITQREFDVLMSFVRNESFADILTVTWEIGEHECDRVVLFDPLSCAEIDSVSAGTATGTSRAVFSPDGRTLAVGLTNGRVVFWRLSNRQILDKKSILTTAAHAGPVRCLAFNRNGTVLVTGGDDKTVIAWDAECGEAIHPFGPGNSPITSVAFSTDGDKIAAGSFLFLRGEINVWEWPSRKLMPDLAGHRLTVWSLAFLRDRMTLLSAGGDRVIKIWDLPTRQERFNLEGYASIFHSLAVSPDETLIAAGARDGTIRLYRAATDDEVNWRLQQAKKPKPGVGPELV